MKAPVSVLMIAGFLCFGGTALAAERSFEVLVFSKTTLFRHDSISDGIVALKRLGSENGFKVQATDDSSAFTHQNLAKFKTIVFLNTSGDILNEEQQSALKGYLETGGGIVGIHAAISGAVATEGEWGWYKDLSCTTFTNHSSVVRATVKVESANHISTSHLPGQWNRTDEWYNFTQNPRPNTHVLATLDESTYEGGTMGKDHPVVWCHPIGKGRFWYTALGHTKESYSEAAFLKHVLGGILFAAQR
ncbi:MAG: ThuA domain-containing protein [Limisphaerales bacterium]